MRKKKQPRVKKSKPSVSKVETVLRQIANEDGHENLRIPITPELLLDKILNPNKRTQVLQLLGISDFQFNPDTTVGNLETAYIHQGAIGKIVPHSQAPSEALRLELETDLSTKDLFLALVRESYSTKSNLIEVIIS